MDSLLALLFLEALDETLKDEVERLKKEKHEDKKPTNVKDNFEKDEIIDSHKDIDRDRNDLILEAIEGYTTLLETDYDVLTLKKQDNHSLKKASETLDKIYKYKEIIRELKATD